MNKIRLNIGYVITMVSLTLVCSWLWLSLPDQVELPFDRKSAYPFTDIHDGGGSTLKIKNDPQLDSSRLIYDVHLRPGLQYPYAGISFSQRDLNLERNDTLSQTLNSDKPSKQCQDWTRLSKISFQLIAKNPGTLSLDFKNWEEGRTVLGDEMSYRILRKDADIQPGNNTLNFPIEHFNIPEWVRKHQKLKNEDDEKHLHSVCLIDIAHGDMQNPVNQIEVVSIKLVFDYSTEKSLLLLGFIFSLIGLYWVKLQSGKRKAKEDLLENNREKVKEEIRKLKTPDEWPQIVDWMKEHFDDSELNLDRAAQGVKMSTSKLTSMIKSQTGLSFKAFLNELRVERACQLLKDTEEQVLQVALSCGYNTVAHFNRLFKERFDQTPTQWRKSQKLSKSKDL